jgi:hypothetical protein
MLDLMLGNADDAFSCGEVAAKYRPFVSYHYDAECRCGQSPCPVWQKIGNIKEHQFHAAVVEKLGATYVIDSTKELRWAIDSQNWAAANGLRVLNVVIWKNPVDLAHSYWKRGGGLRAWYRPFVSYYSKLLETKLPFRSVYFNELVSDPSGNLEKVCSAVGMPYFEGKERFWEGEHHYVFGSQGAYKQTAVGDSKIEKSEKYPPEFQAHIEELSRYISEDSKLRSILQALERAQVSSAGGFSEEEGRYVASKPYPLWYYGMQVRHVFRRYLPDRFVMPR